MEVRNCSRCKKLFQYLSGPPLCPSCRDAEEQEFQKVKQYLRENPRSTITEVAETLEISVDKINRYLREGRLEIAPGSVITLECESCGASITSGRYCNSCSGRLEDDLKSTADALRARANQTPQSLMKFLRKEE